MQIKIINYKKLLKKDGLWILLALVDLLLIIIYLFSLSKSLANYRNIPDGDAWKSFYRNNAKRTFQEMAQQVYAYLATYGQNQQQIYIKLIESNFPIIQLNVPQKEWQELNENLPASGKRYVTAKIKTKSLKEEVLIKYHGDSHYHWGFNKKSYKIKLKNGEIINFINPKSPSLLGDKLAFDLISIQGQYVPENKLVGLFINNQFKGIYLQVQDLDSEFAQADPQHFSAIWKGENVFASARSGESLFADPSKWDLAAGYESSAELENFLTSLANKDYQQLFNYFDFDYLTNYYASIDFLNTTHRDYEHNWVLATKKETGKHYPLLWDPLSWHNWEKKSLNKPQFEEINSPVSLVLRKNAYFNQAISEKLWRLLQDQKAFDQLQSRSDIYTNRLENVLDWDYFKGSYYGNSGGIRFPQTTQEVISAAKDLINFIHQRRKLLISEYQKGTAKYFLKDGYLYLQYSGYAGVLPDLGTAGDWQIYNHGQYQSLPSDLNLLVSGRQTLDPKWANLCPTTYRLNIGNSNLIGSEIVLIHSLTNKPISIKNEHFEVHDCQIDLTNPLLSQDKQPKTAPIQSNSIHLTFKKIDLSEYLDFSEKANTTVNISWDNLNSKAKMRKKAFEYGFRLNLDETIDGKRKYWLQPAGLAKNSNQALKELQSTGLPTPSHQLVTLFANNFKIGDYYLMEYPDKPFFELNQRTYDTNIYLKNSLNTIEADGWSKLSGQNSSPLERLLTAANDQRGLENLVDMQSFRQFYNFIKDTGNENLEYLLYFDNTRGKFEFIPYYFNLYQTNNFSIKDPLIKSVYEYFETRNWFINQDFISPEQSNLGEFSRYLVNEQIIIPEKTKLKIIDDIIIPSNIKLTINQGVELEVSADKSIVSYGKILALGSNNLPIKIHSAESNRPFGTLALIDQGSNDSLFQYVEFSNGSEAQIKDLYLSGMLSVYHANGITVANSDFIQAQADDAVNFKYGSAKIINSRFTDNSADAVDFDFMTGEISNNYFTNNGNDGIDISGSTTMVKNNQLINSGDKGVSIGEKSDLVLNNNLFEGCRIGLEVKDLSNVTSNAAIFRNNDIAINAYQKKEFFGSAIVEVYGSEFINNKQDTTLINTFTGEKFSSDNSQINVH